MKRSPLLLPLLGLLCVLFLLRIDLWQWTDASFVLGLPIGLTYQVAFCLVVAVVMALLVRFAWPLEDPDESVIEVSVTEEVE